MITDVVCWICRERGHLIINAPNDGKTRPINFTFGNRNCTKYPNAQLLFVFLENFNLLLFINIFIYIIFIIFM